MNIHPLQDRAINLNVSNDEKGTRTICSAYELWLGTSCDQLLVRITVCKMYFYLHIHKDGFDQYLLKELLKNEDFPLDITVEALKKVPELLNRYSQILDDEQRKQEELERLYSEVQAEFIEGCTKALEPPKAKKRAPRKTKTKRLAA